MKTPPVDFLRKRRSPWAGWVLLTLACASACAAWSYHYRVSEQRQHARAVAQQLQDRVARARSLAQRPPASSLEERRLQRMRQLLRQPWLETLRTVENVTESPVYLVLLSIDPSTGRVQLDGEAPGFADALDYAQRLADPGALAAPKLVSHEQLSDALTGGTKLRFSIAGQWAQR